METIRKNIGTILFTLLAVALAVAVIHLADARAAPDQVGGGTATYNPWSPSPAAVVSTPATATSNPAAGEPEDGDGDGGGDGGGDG